MSAPLLCEPVRSGSFSPMLVTSTERVSNFSSKDTTPTSIAENSSAVERSISPISDQDTPQAYDHPRRFPCKARGVSGCHTARTAYIDIPANAIHGMILICSFPWCSASGRRFRYCAVCELPVAKRNFSKRHSHGCLVESAEATASSSGTAVNEVPGECAVKDDGSSTRSFKRQRLHSQGDALRFLQEQHTRDMYTGPDIAVSNQELQVPRPVVIEPAPSATSARQVISTASSDLTDKELNWLALYRNRPTSLKTDQEFRAWMDTIVETAEISCESQDPSNVDNNLDDNDHDEVYEDLDISDIHDLVSQYFDIS